MTSYRISVDTWSGVLMDGRIEAETLFKAARKAQSLMGGTIRVVKSNKNESVIYHLTRPIDKTRRATHGKNEIFATIMRESN